MYYMIFYFVNICIYYNTYIKATNISKMFKIIIITIFHVHFDMDSAVGTSQRGKRD